MILWSTATSAGVGAAFAAIPNLIVIAVGERQTGEATGVNTVMRNIGSAVGAQVAGTIIATHVLASGLPENADRLPRQRDRRLRCGRLRAADPGPRPQEVRAGAGPGDPGRRSRFRMNASAPASLYDVSAFDE